MDKFLRFLGGAAISIAYVVLALVVGSAVASAAPDLSAVCAVAALLGWVAIIIATFRKEQPWVAYGILAAPFIVALLATLSCFVYISVSPAPAAG